MKEIKKIKDKLNCHLFRDADHYNNLNAEQKFTVCKFFHDEFGLMMARNFEGTVRLLIDRGNQLRRKNDHIYSFGYIAELPESFNFKEFTHADLALLAKELYGLKNILLANQLKDSLDIMSDSERELLINEANETITRLDNSSKEYKRKLDKVIAVLWKLRREPELTDKELYSIYDEAMEVKR